MYTTPSPWPPCPRPPQDVAPSAARPPRWPLPPAQWSLGPLAAPWKSGQIPSRDLCPDRRTLHQGRWVFPCRPADGPGRPLCPPPGCSPTPKPLRLFVVRSALRSPTRCLAFSVFLCGFSQPGPRGLESIGFVKPPARNSARPRAGTSSVFLAEGTGA